MNDKILTDTVLRQYLLGKVDDEEREHIEKLFLTDSQTRDRVLAAEQGLIEDYLEDGLTAADKETFVLHYAQTPEQQRKLRINQTIKDWAVTEAQTAPGGVSNWSRLLESMRLRLAFVVPVAAAILIAIVIASVWLSRTMEHRAIQKEIAQLNTPASLSRNPAHMISLQLTPLTVRSGETQNRLTKHADVRTVELSLLSIEREKYPAYRVIVNRVGDKEALATVDVAPEKDNAVRVRLPADRLIRGSYRLTSSGIAPDGTTGPTEEYIFVVDD